MSEELQEREWRGRDSDELMRVFAACHRVDLARYDSGFLARALAKRQAAAGRMDSGSYLDLLRDDEVEALRLEAELRVTFSEFFRSSLVFGLLESCVLPRLLADAEDAGSSEVRVWSAGCAAGQEAYSVAILLGELAGERMRHHAYRIFGTDIDETALAAAREARYEAATLRNVRLGQLEKFFAPAPGGYRVNAEVRARVDFSRHDLFDSGAARPPASIYGEFDLVLCSNLLFYYRPDARRAILDRLHAALSPAGYLATGEVERGFVDEYPGFRVVAPPAPVYRRVG